MLLVHFVPFWSYNNPKSFCNIHKLEPIQLLHVCSHPITLFSAKFAPNTSLTCNEREYIDYDVMYLPILSILYCAKVLLESLLAEWLGGWTQVDCIHGVLEFAACLVLQTGIEPGWFQSLS